MGILTIFVNSYPSRAAFSSLYSFARAAITKENRLGGLNNKILFIYFLPFWKLEVPDQDVGRIGFF